MAANSSPALPDLQLRNSTLKADLRRNPTHDAIPAEKPEVLASRIFDEAVVRARESNQSIAHALGVNESVVGRWRNPNAREFPSLLQLQRLGPDFLMAFNRASSKHNGLGRRALAAVLDAVGDLAVAVGE